MIGPTNVVFGETIGIVRSTIDVCAETALIDGDAGLFAKSAAPIARQKSTTDGNRSSLCPNEAM